jgi:hypothetical protein
MHSIGKKNKYIGLLFMKISKEYFALGRGGIHKVSADHVAHLEKYADKLTHVVCTGLDGRYDQITVIEADTLEEIHNTAVDFLIGAKAKYIDINDVVVGIKAPPRTRAAK